MARSRPFFTTSTLEVDEREGNGTSVNGVKRVGYGENDEQLGGAFQSDDTPVFGQRLIPRNTGKLKPKILIPLKVGYNPRKRHLY